jgi:hypothetical protein
MESAPSANYSLKIKSDNKTYDLKFAIKSDKLDISISNNSSISLSFNAAFTFDELLKLNRYFRQFDTILEIYNFIVNLENIEELIDIKVENKFINLKISIPSVLKNKANNEIIFVLPAVQIKESELIVKLCQEVEKINILEKKINYIFLCIGKTEEDFKTYEETVEKLPQNLKHLSTVMESRIVSPEDFATVQIGIKEKLNKTIKGAKLLYRASRDGDKNQFHSKCDGIENTVTFVKAKNGRKFGGFANKAFNSSNQWISDPNCFVFSLLHKECYYYNNNGNMICGNSSYGPLWGGGSGHDLYLASGCLNNTTSTTNQNSFDYKGKSNALSGGTSFQAEDYETYQLILE